MFTGFKMARLRLLLCVLYISGRPWPSETLKLVNNGYEDLVVAIGQDVLEDKRYFGQIESLIKETSDYLYTATRHRSYIRSVKVLVPTTWGDDPSYTDPGEATFDKAEIRIDTPNPVQGNNPYTFQPGQCGDPGEYIHLSPDYVLDNSGIDRERNWGSSGRLLVHEFAHLRYGVFDEYGTLGDPQHPVFYLNDKARVVPTSCTAEIKGRMTMGTGRGCALNVSTNLPEDGCDFFPNEDSNDAIASVMYIQFLKNITDFCEVIPVDPRLQHNEFAPNMHNKMCPGRGTWDVIKAHPDFKSSNPARNVSDTTPTFSHVYNRRGYWQDGTEKCGRRVVVLLDLSGSMKQNERWFKQTQTADKFIRDILPIGSNVGIVTFSTYASQWAPMTPLRTDFIKNAIASGLPMLKDIDGGTAIGRGFQKALELLRATGGTEGGRILLITDGEENQGPRVATIINDIINAAVVVHTVAYSAAAADALATISQKTDGMYAYFSESEVSTSLDSSIRRLWDDMAVCKERTQIEIFRTGIKMTVVNLEYKGTVDIDNTVGQDTVFVFTFPRSASIEVHVTSPHGDEFDRNSTGYSQDTNLNIARLKLQVAANNTGSWTYTLISKTPGSHIVSITVTSKPRDRKSTYQFHTWLSGLSVTVASKPTVYAHVHKGYSPVLYANVSISIEKPGGQIDVVYPRDDGRVPDNTRNDGVYTAYVVSFSSNDRYSLDASVTNIPGKTSVLVAGIGSGRSRSKTYNKIRSEIPEPVTTNFTRTSSPGSVHVTGVNPGVDTLPPGRITDLWGRVVKGESGVVELTWTSPGDDLDKGTATSYDLRVGHSFQQMTKSFQEAIPVDKSFLVAGTTIPLPAGERHEVIIKIPFPFNHSTLVFGVKATDDVSLTSELSNLVVVSFRSVKMAVGASPTDVMVRSLLEAIFFTIAFVSIITLVKKSKLMNKRNRGYFKDVEAQSLSLESFEVGKVIQVICSRDRDSHFSSEIYRE